MIGQVKPKDGQPQHESRVTVSILAQFFEPYVVNESSARIFEKLDSTPKASIGFSAIGPQVGRPQVARTSGCVESASVKWDSKLLAGEIVVQCKLGLAPGLYQGALLLSPTMGEPSTSPLDENRLVPSSGRLFKVPVELVVVKPYSLDTNFVDLRGPVDTTATVHLLETDSEVSCAFSNVIHRPDGFDSEIHNDGMSLRLRKIQQVSGHNQSLEVEVSVLDGKYVVAESIGYLN